MSHRRGLGFQTEALSSGHRTMKEIIHFDGETLIEIQDGQISIPEGVTPEQLAKALLYAHGEIESLEKRLSEWARLARR